MELCAQKYSTRDKFILFFSNLRLFLPVSLSLSTKEVHAEGTPLRPFRHLLRGCWILQTGEESVCCGPGMAPVAGPAVRFHTRWVAVYKNLLCLCTCLTSSVCHCTQKAAHLPSPPWARWLGPLAAKGPLGAQLVACKLKDWDSKSLIHPIKHK